MMNPYDDTPAPMRRRPNGSPPLPMHSIRCEDEVWAPAKMLAAKNGLTMTALVVNLLRLYVQKNGDIENG